MFEGWFGKKQEKEEQTEESLAFKKEGWEAYNKLSPKWQKKVSELLEPARKKYFKPMKYFTGEGVHDPEYYQIMEDVVYTAALLEEQERAARSRIKKIADEIVRQTKRNIVLVGISILLSVSVSMRADHLKLKRAEAEATELGIETGVLEDFKRADDPVFHHDKVLIFKNGKYAKDIPRTVSSEGLDHMSIEGFDKFNVSETVIRRVVEETMPRSLVANFRGVKYVDKDIPMPKSYGPKVSKFEAAHFDPVRKVLVISRGSLVDTPDSFINGKIMHEDGHASDWTANESLSVEERLKLLSDIVERVQSPDRFKSAYVEAISSDDKANELNAKKDEYFAEIVSAYLSDDYVKLPAADRKIIRELIAKFDPGFDRASALAKRKVIIKACEEQIDYDIKHPKESDFEDK